MTREGPAWLADFQARFGDVIRTPLDRSTATLVAATAAYDARMLVDARKGPAATGADRLAVYNRQYWFRLFGVLQSAFPLTSRLVGCWAFNEHAARHLHSRQPRGWDIDRVADGFDTFLEEALDHERPSERLALIEAVRIDAAWRDVFRAPHTSQFRPSAADAPRLLDAHLTPSPAWRIVMEHRALLDLRKELLPDTGESIVELPPLLPRPRWWSLVRRDDGISQTPIEPREAELLGYLRETSVREALARLERACSPEERALLPARARAWIARSVEADFWTGLGDEVSRR
jgi:hypothetical protein